MNTKSVLLICALIMLQVCGTLLAQEFSTKLYFESYQGEKDTLEIGYDPSATHGIDSDFGEINYGTPISLDVPFLII